MLDTGISWFLETNSAIRALLDPKGYASSPYVSGRADKTSGIYPVAALSAPTLPYIVFQQISNVPNNTMAGVNRFQQSRVRFLCYGANFTAAKQLARTLKLQLQGFKGVWYSLADDSAQVEVQGAWLASWNDNAEDEAHLTIMNSVIDFNINFIDMQD